MLQPLLEQLAGQPIEQLRMARRLAQAAEVAAAIHQAAAEVILPEAIDHHARRQRIVGRGQPVGQRRAAAGGLRTRATG